MQGRGRFRTARAVTGALVALLIAVPAAAQFSDSYNFLKAVRDKDGQKVTEMVEGKNSTIINTKDYANGEGALHIVVKRRDELWIDFMLAKGANPNLRDKQGNTPLMVAAQLGFPEGEAKLIEWKADVNLPNAQGETPLIAAVQRRDIVSVRLLLAAGANTATADHLAGMSARDYAQRDPRASAILKLIDDAANARKPVVKPAGPGL